MRSVPDDPPITSNGAGGERSEAHPPMPRDKRGWQVAPAPDGRGMPEQAPTGTPPHRRRGFWWFVLALIALNWLSVLFFQPSTGEPRVTVPFSPYFLEQVKGGDGQLDLLQGRHDPGQVQDQAALPGERQEGDADEAVRDAGPELLERQRSCPRCCRKRAWRSTPNRRARASRCWRSCCSASARRC